MACVEDIGGGNTTLFHTSLDNGTAGCGFFLHDLSIVTGDPRYAAAAHRMIGWLRAVARFDPHGIWWYDAVNTKSNRWFSPKEMSWHWGQAGIIAFLARLSGWRVSMPVEQQSIVPLRPAAEVRGQWTGFKCHR